jgi:hypothetical protein
MIVSQLRQPVIDRHAVGLGGETADVAESCQLGLRVCNGINYWASLYPLDDESSCGMR